MVSNMYTKSLFVFLCVLTINIYAQEYNGDLILTSQQQVDDFNYTVVNGTLVIEEQTSGNITNLDGLSELVFAKSLEIQNNSALNNLNGLAGLEAVEFLKLEGNSSLTGITVFHNLHSFHAFWLINNQSITSIDGILGLHSTYWIVDDLVILNNPSLNNINALRRANWLSNALIDNNASLTNIDSLNNPGYLGTITISNNAALTNINGLADRDALNNLALINNDALTNVNALSSLRTLNHLIIKENDNLNNLNGLSGIEELKFLEIAHNDKVPNLDFLSNITNADSIFIENNDLISNLNGLAALTTVKKLFLINNPILDDISVLTNLRVEKTIAIGNNPLLSNFCSLFLTASQPGFPGNEILIDGNAANPDRDEIVNMGPCAPSTYQGDVLFSDMHEIDGFNYTKVTGSVIIGCPGIFNLDGLSELDSIGGDLVLARNSNLYDISGLRHLKYIGGKLRIFGNRSIAFLKAFSSLEFVGDSVIIDINRNLIEFCGLYNLFANGMSGPVKISHNGSNPTKQQIIDAGPCGDDLFEGELIIANQADADAFHYRLISGSLKIQEESHGSITSLQHLSTLQWAKYIRIQDNSTLPNLDGLDNLTASDVINIANNDALADIDALSQLTEVVDGLTVTDNNSLTSIKGLSGLTYTSQINVTINPLLTEFCSLYTLLTESDPYYFVNGNGANPTKAQIIAGGPCSESDASITDVTSSQNLIPKEFSLSQNYPNPFNPATVFKYALPEAANVSLKIYNSLGELVTTLINGHISEGYHEFTFDASSLTSGIYFYRLDAGKFSKTNKMILLR